MPKEYWITNSRFKLIAVLLILMWLILIIFFYLKADEVTKHPCQICAKQMGVDVNCKIKGSYMNYEQTFYENGTIYTGNPLADIDYWSLDGIGNT